MSDVRSMYIGGQFTAARGGATFPVRDPATGETVAEVPDAGPEDVRAAVDAAAATFPAWAALPAVERGRYLLRAREILLARADAIARLITLENGKPLAEARRELEFSLGYLDWFAAEARRAYGEIVPSPQPHRRLWVIRQPVGVVAAITPWNFPALMITRKVAPALAAGCTVVLKPASATPLTALAIAEAFAEAGLPAGVFNVVTGRRSGMIAQAFLDDPRVRKIAFTGSTEVGKELMRGAAAGLKRVSFELGGNAPLVVFDDDDLERAVTGAVAIKYLRVGGQSCICANRIYVQEGVAEAFLAAFRERVRALRVGPGLEPGVEVGPLINEAAVAKVEELVAEAVAAGARVTVGGHRLSEGAYARGHFYAPTVVEGVREDMRLAREEIFGPVAPVLTFRSEEELLARANDTPYGLAAYLFTRDLSRAIRVAEGLEYGLIGLNDAGGYTHEIPFGGFKESGLGREGGRDGLEEYLETKSIVVGL